MPIMNGYDFFVKVSSTPEWSRIPFIFLTAKTTPEDIRFGKLLGVDDYITKPFEQDDLLAVIKGKIKRKEKIKSIENRIKKFVEENEDKITISGKYSDDQGKCAVLLIMFWDDKLGPKLMYYNSIRENLPYSLDEIGRQLFHASVFIYGHNKMEKAQGILVNIENINRKGYAYFDSYPDKDLRSGQQQYMIAFITKELSYFKSLKIRNIFKEISKNIKKMKPEMLETYLYEIIELEY